MNHKNFVYICVYQNNIYLTYNAIKRIIIMLMVIMLNSYYAILSSFG